MTRMGIGLGSLADIAVYWQCCVCMCTKTTRITVHGCLYQALHYMGLPSLGFEVYSAFGNPRREYPTLTALTYVCRRRGVSGYTIIWKAQWCWKGPSILILNMSDPLFLYWFVLGGFLVTFWGEHIVNEHQWYIIATLYKYRRKWSIYIYIYIFILYLIDI